MSKTKFRSLGMGFLVAALILALVTVIWPLVPHSLKSQLDAVNLPTEAATTQSSKPVSITVEEGESSNDVAEKLEKAGLIKSAKEFVDYLTTNNIAENIWTGTFEIKPGSSNEEIARAIGALR